jgi:hypothetical protein
MLLRNRGSASLPSHGGSDAYGGGSNDSGGSTYGAAYGGYSNGGGSRSSTGSSSSSMKRRTSGSFSTPRLLGNPILAVISICVSVLFFILTLSYRSSRNALYTAMDVSNVQGAISKMERYQMETKRWERQVEQVKAESQRKFTQQINALERDNRLMQKERDELRVKYEGAEKQDEEARLVARDKAWKEQVTLLQKATRQESKRSVLERYVCTFFVVVVVWYPMEPQTRTMSEWGQRHWQPKQPKTQSWV